MMRAACRCLLPSRWEVRDVHSSRFASADPAEDPPVTEPAGALRHGSVWRNPAVESGTPFSGFVAISRQPRKYANRVNGRAVPGLTSTVAPSTFA